MGENHKKIGRVAIGVFVYFLATMVLRPMYYLNDDVTIRSILSGVYTGTPDGHGVYMEYPLTGLLALLYRAMPDTPWFDLFLSGCLIFGIYAIVTSVKTKSILQKILLALLVLALFWDTLWYMHYTIVAAFLMGTGIVLWMTHKKKYLSVLSFILGYMVRKQVFLLGLPFLLVAMLFGALNLSGKEVKEDEEAEKVETKKANPVIEAVKGLVILAVLAAGCMGLHVVMYGADEWKDYERFNTARTGLYDYSAFVSLADDDPIITNLSMDPDMRKILVSYDTMLDQSLTESVLNETLRQVPGTKTDLKTAILGYLNHLKHDRYPLRFGLIAAYIGLFYLLIRKKKLKLLFPVICLLGGRSLIWIYLMQEGRFPERIAFSLLIIEILLVGGMLVKVGEASLKDANLLKKESSSEENEITKSLKNLKNLKNPKILLAAVCIAGFFGWNLIYTAGRMENQNIFQSQWDNLKDYCNTREDNLYLLDVYSVVTYADRLYEEESYNTMLLGGWITGSPLAYERFNRAVLGVGDGADTLYCSDRVFFVTDTNPEVGVDVSWLESYLSKRYGKVVMQQVDTVECGPDKTFAVYGLKR